MWGHKRRLVGSESENKRLKLADDIEENLLKVQEALDDLTGRGDGCCVMIQNIVPGALGPAMNERDELQAEGVEMIGKVLDSMEEEAIKALKRAEAIQKDPDAAKQDLEKEADDENASKAAEERNRAAKLKVVEDAKKLLAKAADKLKEASGAKNKLDGKQQQLKVERDNLSDAHTEHYVPLRDGDWDKERQASGHISALLPVFKGLEKEESLISAFEKAALHKPAVRRSFDKQSVKAADFQSTIAELQQQIQGMEEPLRNADLAVEAARAAKDQAGRKYKLALEDLGGMLSRISKWLGGLFKTRKLLDNFPKDEKEREALVQEAKHTLRELQAAEGPISAFEYLRDRVAPAPAA